MSSTTYSIYIYSIYIYISINIHLHKSKHILQSIDFTHQLILTRFAKNGRTYMWKVVNSRPQRPQGQPVTKSCLTVQPPVRLFHFNRPDKNRDRKHTNNRYIVLKYCYPSIAGHGVGGLVIPICCIYISQQRPTLNAPNRGLLKMERNLKFNFE